MRNNAKSKFDKDYYILVNNATFDTSLKNMGAYMKFLKFN